MYVQWEVEKYGIENILRTTDSGPYISIFLFPVLKNMCYCSKINCSPGKFCGGVKCSFLSFIYFLILTKQRVLLLGYVKYPIIIIGIAKIPDNKVFLNVYMYNVTYQH